MDPFEDATIVANFVTKYHTITNAHVQVLARRVYEASGKYVYVDAKENEHTITLTEIRPDTTDQTVALGEIKQDENFKLSPQFDFYGKVHLQASEQFLTFEGATRINHDCDQFAKNWMQFKTQVDPNNSQVPVNDKMTDLDGNTIAVGIVLRNTSDYDSLGIYPAFLSSLDNDDDKILNVRVFVLDHYENIRNR